jgi:hypothetical protein
LFNVVETPNPSKFAKKISKNFQEKYIMNLKRLGSSVFMNTLYSSPKIQSKVKVRMPLGRVTLISLGFEQSRTLVSIMQKDKEVSFHYE